MENRNLSKLQEEINETFELHRQHALKLRLSTKEERARKLSKLREWIKKNKAEIRKALYADFKKPATEVDLTETYLVLSEINLALKNLSKWMQPKKVKNPITLTGSSAYIQYEPKGTSLIISPWNFPFQLAVTPLVSAIAAGCTAIMKPSESSPHTSALLRRMVMEVFSRDDVALFEGEVEVATMLLEKPFDHIFFTGSPKVGRIVMKAAAENLSSVTLELGGKSPVIIDKNANLEDAAQKIVWAKFMNAGQTCIAPDYLMVHSSIVDPFLAEVKNQIHKMYGSKGKAIAKSKDYARIINERHHKQLSRLLSDARLKGASIFFGGDTDEEENYLEPTILTQVTEAMDIMHEEIFGPILPVVTYTDIEDIVHTINSKPKPLALYIFSDEQFVIDFVLSNTSSGGVCINDCIVHYMSPDLPFGGVNESGIGKAHGHFGFKAFSNEKAVLKQRVGMTPAKMFYPPYGFAEKRISKLFLKIFG
ncbi:aldehyde dehydrogenase family protein [Litoribacter ruber]|uniref:aldehyde dehydrogenase family protein n=1 Tax=Litoribacter ruber TaxID=702568 RepID=UPI001BDA0C83|nr:aldehyde dehydrogenase family protein [Litoribacter ruber]MBT0812002.1 aldehyde dehydrogenase family protein [Litoribacter ruber]